MYSTALLRNELHTLKKPMTALITIFTVKILLNIIHVMLNIYDLLHNAFCYLY